MPLLLFAFAARRLSLTTLGLLQYLSPTIQFLLGIWLFHEPFGATRLVGFVLIWIALALYSLRRPARRRAPAIAAGLRRNLTSDLAPRSPAPPR